MSSLELGFLDGHEAHDDEWSDEDPVGLVDRRSMLKLGVAAAGGTALAGAGSLLLPDEAAAHGTLRYYSGIAGARTVYDPSRSLRGFYYRPSFHTRLNYWLKGFFNHTPHTFHPRITRVWTFGAHTDHRYSRAHNAGRGFDLSRIYVHTSSGRKRIFSAHYWYWKDLPWREMRMWRRKYWTCAAFCHHFFRHVLTYLYNSAHHNHIHIDNLVSGTDLSRFSTSSRTQVQSVQAMCRYIWGKGTTIDGVWGSQTRRHTAEVNQRVGVGYHSIAYSNFHWHVFLRATTKRGSGLKRY